MIYTFDLIDGSSQPYDLQIGIFVDEQAARSVARSLFKAHTGASVIDIWHMGLRIARIERAGSACSEVVHP